MLPTVLFEIPKEHAIAFAATRVLLRFSSPSRELNPDQGALKRAVVLQTFVNVRAVVASDPGHSAGRARWGTVVWQLGVCAVLCIVWDVFAPSIALLGVDGQSGPIVFDRGYVDRAYSLLNVALVQRDVLRIYDHGAPMGSLTNDQLFPQVALNASVAPGFVPPTGSGNFPATVVTSFFMPSSLHKSSRKRIDFGSAAGSSSAMPHATPFFIGVACPVPGGQDAEGDVKVGMADPSDGVAMHVGYGPGGTSARVSWAVSVAGPLQKTDREIMQRFLLRGEVEVKLDVWCSALKVSKQKWDRAMEIVFPKNVVEEVVKASLVVYFVGKSLDEGTNGSRIVLCERPRERDATITSHNDFMNLVRASSRQYTQAFVDKSREFQTKSGGRRGQSDFSRFFVVVAAPEVADAMADVEVGAGVGADAVVPLMFLVRDLDVSGSIFGAGSSVPLATDHVMYGAVAAVTLYSGVGLAAVGGVVG